jgi:tRNA threonylcarbamoyladenosine biosynthesis protein TsaB
MLILAADTSGKQGSIALVRCQSSFEILEIAPLQGGTFSALLVPQVAALLSAHQLSKTNIDGFSVVSGPGSFTGLRVGLAAIKALAEILNKPVAAISLLEAIARSTNRTGNILAALDAGRNEVYAGEYESSSDRTKLIRERLASAGELVEAARESFLVTPDASVAQLAHEHRLDFQAVEPPGTGFIARLGYEKIQAGELISTEQLDANYIRRSDAEIFSKPPS